jgi:hypothetical protein
MRRPIERGVKLSVRVWYALNSHAKSHLHSLRQLQNSRSLRVQRLLALSPRLLEVDQLPAPTHKAIPSPESLNRVENRYPVTMGVRTLVIKREQINYLPGWNPIRRVQKVPQDQQSATTSKLAAVLIELPGSRKKRVKAMKTGPPETDRMRFLEDKDNHLPPLHPRRLTDQLQMVYGSLRVLLHHLRVNLFLHLLVVHQGRSPVNLFLHLLERLEMPHSSAPQTGTGRAQINKGAKEENSSHVKVRVEQNGITLRLDKVAVDSLPVRVKDKAEDNVLPEVDPEPVAKEENSSHVKVRAEQNGITLRLDKVAVDSRPVRVKDKVVVLATGLQEQEEVRAHLVRVADMLLGPAQLLHPRRFRGVLPVEEGLHRNNLKKGVVVM